MPTQAKLRAFLALSIASSHALSSAAMNRKRFFNRLVGLTSFGLLTGSPTDAFSASSVPSSAARLQPLSLSDPAGAAATVAYKPLSVSINEFGTQVPVACWFPAGKEAYLKTPRSRATYSHRISIRRIGQLLAGWDFIPEFASRNFRLDPTYSKNVVAATDDLDIPKKCPVVILAHGYLGSRFDLSHLAEKLASQGFVCLSPEYPESLAASFDRVDGLDRKRITDSVLANLDEWGIQPSGMGIVGHSLGCGTAMQTGDDSWARVLIAGFPKNRDGTPMPGNLLFLASMGDGLFNSPRNPQGKKIVPSDYTMLEEEDFTAFDDSKRLPRRAALVYDKQDAPNHISFLTPSVNDAMINLLSPLLPVAQAASIPVLDFDRYKDSRDAITTAAKVHPLIVRYLKQEMQGK